MHSFEKFFKRSRTDPIKLRWPVEGRTFDIELFRINWGFTIVLLCWTGVIPVEMRLQFGRLSIDGGIIFLLANSNEKPWSNRISSICSELQGTWP